MQSRAGNNNSVLSVCPGGKREAYGGLKVATPVNYKNNCGQGCTWFKGNWKLYPETTFWESIMG